MTPSLGEVQSTALKACRGAGLPWGLCEEAAWAVRWLWAHGFDGLGALAALLPNYDQNTCPIRAAAALTDGARLPWTGRVAAPLLLMPAAHRMDARLEISGGLDDFAVAEVTVRAGAAEQPATVGRRAVDPAAWKVLKRFEGRTYAPPTAASRAGAGAGLTDND